ncbi:hypothetical protein [Stenotrophomonas sp.]|uniref:hypothetical protein n=1 Tax=Stenotrophomonas sp. TaxID=69392 RepID=UPI0028A5B8FE|nr:hypothetical protein [Stenotrophomonas sp.]
MKAKCVAVCLVISALVGCDRAPSRDAGSIAAPPVAAVEAQADPVPAALPLAETKAEAVRKLPSDEPVLADQLAKFDAAFNSGNIDAYSYTFDSSLRFNGKYPIWTDLDCQVDAQRPNAIWCAYGRMGEPEDRELEGQLPFLANEDVLGSELRCSEVLCINQAGSPVGVIQPQMRQWITANCSRSADLHLTCP